MQALGELLPADDAWYRGKTIFVEDELAAPGSFLLLHLVARWLSDEGASRSGVCHAGGVATVTLMRSSDGRVVYVCGLDTQDHILAVLRKLVRWLWVYGGPRLVLIRACENGVQRVARSALCAPRFSFHSCLDVAMGEMGVNGTDEG